MLENILNRLLELTYNRVRSLISRAIEEGVEHGARDAMRKLGVSDEPISPTGNGKGAVVVIPAKPSPPTLPQQDANQTPVQPEPRKRGRPRKVITYDDPNKS